MSKKEEENEKKKKEKIIIGNLGLIGFPTKEIAQACILSEAATNAILPYLPIIIKLEAVREAAIKFSPYAKTLVEVGKTVDKFGDVGRNLALMGEFKLLKPKDFILAISAEKLQFNRLEAKIDKTNKMIDELLKLLSKPKMSEEDKKRAKKVLEEVNKVMYA